MKSKCLDSPLVLEGWRMLISFTSVLSDFLRFPMYLFVSSEAAAPFATSLSSPD